MPGIYSAFRVEELKAKIKDSVQQVNMIEQVLTRIHFKFQQTNEMRLLSMFNNYMNIRQDKKNQIAILARHFQMILSSITNNESYEPPAKKRRLE